MMICLAWSDESMQKKLEIGLTITKLYEYMVIWLGKRYLKKWEQKNNNDVKELMIDKLLENPVAKSLKEIAFKGFKTE